MSRYKVDPQYWDFYSGMPNPSWYEKGGDEDHEDFVDDIIKKKTKDNTSEYGDDSYEY